MLKGIALAFFCFPLFLCHIFIFHKFNIRRRFFAILKVFLSGLLLYTALFIIIPGSIIQRLAGALPSLRILAFLSGAFLHFFIFYFYLHLIQVVDRSLATRMMVEIENSASNKLTLEEFKKQYSIKKKVVDELSDMVVLGRLSSEGGDFRNTPKGRRHMKVFKFIRDYMKMERN